VNAAHVRREQVTELGAVLAGAAPGRPRGRAGADLMTLFDSTGLAIQDLAIAAAALEAVRSGRISAAQTVKL
jgi:ornithine cyclodeaminase/alanine dehydrogenase-like protein (mu-crystallin family)